jgi:arylsulfatase A-like enzyme
MPKRYTRREAMQSMGALGAASMLGLAGCSTLKSGANGTSTPPNIVFIMTDDHASHALSCYGSVINTTPHLDRIAEGGMRLDNCFCTNSICAPSRACILTGKYSHLNGVLTNGDRFDGSQSTFPKHLQAAGYQTAMIGKWHLKTDPTGFDYWNVLPGQGKYHNPDMKEMGEARKYQGYATDLITDHSINFLENRDTSKPFCLLSQHKAPHRRWQPDAKHADMYKNVDIPVPDTFFDDYSGRGAAARSTEMRVADHMDPEDVKVPVPEGLSERDEALWYYRRYMEDYLAVVASVDDNVGRLLDYLDTAGLADNTIVVYTSDQGFYLGDHGWYDKRFMYEESLRMPFLVRYPEAIKAGSVNDDITLNIDFGPTFMDYAGLDTPTDMQGRSFRRNLEGRTPRDWRESMYYQYYEYPAVHAVKKHYGVRTERYKLIHFYDDVDEWELYDLKKDPDEMQSVYGEARYVNVQSELHTELQALRRELGIVED